MDGSTISLEHNPVIVKLLEEVAALRKRVESLEATIQTDHAKLERLESEHVHDHKVLEKLEQGPSSYYAPPRPRVTVGL